jgi:hypothetical protein
MDMMIPDFNIYHRSLSKLVALENNKPDPEED